MCKNYIDLLLLFTDSVMKVVSWKYLIHFVAGINTKQFWDIPEEKYFAPLSTPNLFIKSLVNPFIDIALTFF